MRATATYFTPAVAPLAGRVPWRFEDVYRQQAKHFGIGGITASLALVAFLPSPVFKVLGIAVLPLCLRTYSSQMLSPHRTAQALDERGRVPRHRPARYSCPPRVMLAAAWMVVVTETILFVGTALLIADRTGVNAYSREKVAAGIGAGALLFAVALPGKTILYVVLIATFAAVVGVIWLPRKAPQS